MPAILAIDTSTEACLVSLLVDGDVINLCHPVAREHAKRALPMVDEVLSSAGLRLKDCDAIAFGRGPGSFTGLRIASGIAQGLAFGADLPVVPVSSLQAKAHCAFRTMLDQGAVLADLPPCAALIDARMDEIYCARYRATDWHGMVMPEAMSEEQVCKPEAFTLGTSDRYVAIGDGLAYRDRFQPEIDQQLAVVSESDMLNSQAIAELALPAWQQGGGLAAEQAAPVYVRDTVAWKKLPGRE